MDKRNLARLLFVRPLTALVGRRNTYRFSRFLIEQSRRDVRNCISTNGERIVQATMLRWSADPVIFDVGANIGNWTASLLQLANPAGRKVTVHAFEPCAGTIRQLRQRIEHDHWLNVIAVPQACSSAPGRAALSVKFDGCSSNSIVESVEALSATRQEAVELSSVDAYCASHSIQRVDLLKVDTEGHDFEVILGAKEMLKRKAIGLLQFEYNQRWITARRYLRDVFAFMKPLGYALGKITSEGIEFYPEWQWEMETYWEANYLACTQEWPERFPCLTPTWLIDP